MYRWIILCVCVCAAASSAWAQSDQADPGALQERIVDVREGFSFSVPDTWSRVPDAEIEMLIEMTRPGNPDASWTFLEGYSPTGTLASTPYMLVQKNRDGFRRASRAEIIEAFGALELSEVASTLEESSAGIFDEISIERPVFDEERTRVLIRAVAGGADGVMDVFMVINLGMDSAIQFNFYTPEGGLENHIGTFNEISDSFAYAKDSQRWTPPLVATPRGAWRHVINGGIGAAIGLICVLVITLVKKSKG